MERYSRSSNVIDGDLDDHQVMMHLEKGKYFGLNPVGKRIWELIEEPKTFSEIVKPLLLEFDVSEEQCKAEVKNFLDKAIEYDIVSKIE